MACRIAINCLNVPIDLSQILFIFTANSLDTISPPLDRCEIIQLSGYTYHEKPQIARRFLLPKQLTQNGLSEADVQLTERALLQTVMHYTREAGVRSLESAICGIARFKAVEWAAHVDAQGLPPPAFLVTISFTGSSLGNFECAGQAYRGWRCEYNPIVEVDELEKILGLSRYNGEDCEREERRGVVWGLVTGMGEIIPVESIATPGSGHLKLTGSLGDVRPKFVMHSR